MKIGDKVKIMKANRPEFLGKTGVVVWIGSLVTVELNPGREVMMPAENLREEKVS